MERASVIQQLRAWADGVDATTGETLPPDHPGQRPETLRVVFGALALLQADADRALRTPASAAVRARNAGLPWSAQDDAALASGFDAGQPVAALAAQLERTRGAINSRLVRLGKIELPPGLRLRGEPGASPTPASSARPEARDGPMAPP